MHSISLKVHAWVGGIVHVRDPCGLRSHLKRLSRVTCSVVPRLAALLVASGGRAEEALARPSKERAFRNEAFIRGESETRKTCERDEEECEYECMCGCECKCVKASRRWSRR